MKKKQRMEQKTKDFAHTPFKSLKGMKAETEGPKAKAPVAPPVVQDTTEEDDTKLFLRSVADVKRLGTPVRGEKMSATVSPAPEKIDTGESRLFLESLKQMDVTFRDEFPDVKPLAPVAVNRMRQLKTGAIRIDLELDLHGLTREEAVKSLERFISNAFNRGQKAVLVITGKGNNSPGEPVLQAAVVSWLRGAGKNMVAEFAPAPKNMGDSGALVVFLKDKNKVMKKV